MFARLRKTGWRCTYAHHLGAARHSPTSHRTIILLSNATGHITKEARMPMTLEGSCRCGAVRFTVESHTPYPYQRCYCSICRKQDGGGGYAINIMGDADTLKVEGEDA